MPIICLHHVNNFTCVVTFALSHFSHLTICDAANCGLPGFSVCGILQARILEWVAMPSSGGSSQLRDQTYISCIGRQVLYH